MYEYGILIFIKLAMLLYLLLHFAIFLAFEHFPQLHHQTYIKVTFEVSLSSIYGDALQEIEETSKFSMIHKEYIVWVEGGRT